MIREIKLVTHLSHNLKNDFLLNPDVIFLNHGSFGATPIPVFNKYQEWQRLVEYQPVDFFSRKASGFLQSARRELGDFLGTSGDNLVYITNTTFGINIIARSLKLGTGDQVLTTNHEYGAMDRVWNFMADRQGFTYIKQPISIPLSTRDSLIDEFWQGVTPHTKVIFFSHITSPTAITFPVKEICTRAKAEGILTVVDGAHAPGQIDLSLEDLGVDFYAGNLHKWLCAPKGSAFLFARPQVQHLVEPLVISWGWNPIHAPESLFISHLEQNGTRDISAFLSVPEAIRFFGNPVLIQKRKDCHQFVEWITSQLSHISGISSIYGTDPTWYSQMASSVLPPDINPDELKTFLLDLHHIEVPIVRWNNQIIVRYSIQVYNTEDDAQALIESISKFLQARIN
jgi:isopenicillin-N epimerase